MPYHCSAWLALLLLKATAAVAAAPGIVAVPAAPALGIGEEPQKVWVLTNHAATECEYLGTNNRVFAKKEDALKALAEWKKDEEVYVKRYEWNVCSDTPEHYEAYEEGDYCANHTEGFINEYEVK